MHFQIQLHLQIFFVKVVFPAPKSPISPRQPPFLNFLAIFTASSSISSKFNIFLFISPLFYKNLLFTHLFIWRLLIRFQYSIYNLRCRNIVHKWQNLHFSTIFLNNFRLWQILFLVISTLHMNIRFQ